MRPRAPRQQGRRAAPGPESPLDIAAATGPQARPGQVTVYYSAELEVQDHERQKKNVRAQQKTEVPK
jgi:hypothetical protein